MLDANDLSAIDINYFGFGKPGEAGDVLGCNQHDITLLFEVDTREGQVFGRTPFIIPPSLRTPENKFVGEIIMTLVYSPPLDYVFPSEYCRRNVDVSFGTYDQKNGKVEHKGKVPQINDVSEMYEKSLIQHGFKWSPVKVYRKRFPQGVQGDNWRLKLEVLRRAEEDPLEYPQRAVLVLTMRSLDKSKAIYSEAVAEMKTAGWMTVDLIQSIPLRVKV
jgi:serine protease AprX